MRVLIYSDTPAARELRAQLKADKHTVILCNPDFFRPADLSEAEVVYFPKAHPKAAEVEALAALPFGQAHPRAGQTVDLQWITAKKAAAAAKEPTPDKE